MTTTDIPRTGPDPEAVEALLHAAEAPARRAMALHPHYRGKVQVLPKCTVTGLEDFATWYTPGVAAPCRAISAEPERVWEMTNRANTVAIVSDGSRVLGLGDIGPRAGLPVMEGKALLFKYLGGVDAVPLCIDVHDPDGIVALLRAIEPSFGGINLEDIAQPRCFTVLEEARRSLRIPVWHDDQQGTATVVLAALTNACDVVGKRLQDVRIVLVGVGAANTPVYRLLTAVGVDPGHVVAVDRGGTLHAGRDDLRAVRDTFVDKWRICQESNADGVEGGVAEALVGADVCVAFSTPGPGTIRPEWVARMADDAIVLAGANPVPEIWPWEAEAAGAAVVATGRSDFPNQVNNSLGFPAIFRGALDVRASTITDGMAIAAATELAAYAREGGLHRGRILPTMADWEVYPRVAAATGVQAQREGVAAVGADMTTLHDLARRTIGAARDATRVLIESGAIPAPPHDEEPGVVG